MKSHTALPLRPALLAALLAGCGAPLSSDPGCDEGFVRIGPSCKPDLCQDLYCGDGFCAQNGEEAECVCPTGFAGEACAVCAAGFHPDAGGCAADATCTGDDCSPPTPPDPCTPNPCHDLGRTACTVVGESFACSCGTGYSEDEGECLADCDAGASLCAAAHPSAASLVSTNGFGAVVYDPATRAATTFMEHLYRNWDADVWTRDLLYDTYLGLRTGSGSAWLNTVAPTYAGYYKDSGIIRIVHLRGNLRVETFILAPFQLHRPAVVLLGRVTNLGTGTETASLYSIHNYHLGSTTVADPSHPNAQAERLVYQAATGAYLEEGVGGRLLHFPLGSPDRHGATPNNPWAALNAGQDLANDADSGVGDDRVAGFQKNLTLAPGESGWLGVVTAFDTSQDPTALANDVQTTYGSRSPEVVLADAVTEWERWRKPPPASLSPAELSVYRQGEATLRQAQVLETSDKSYGQLLASLPPGQWNITWMRDMSYAIVALARSGHVSEAEAALEFVLNADVGTYASYVGRPYQVSVVRYFGRGKEESDVNADGPNVELDGFGLFLWALAETLDAGGSTTLTSGANWTKVTTKVADVLVAARDGTNGLIVPDSSIWEVHWNGKEKHFSYSSLAAAQGLCLAAELATANGDNALATTYRTAGRSIRDALFTHVRDANGALASSTEELAAGSGTFDMATIEAPNWGLFAPAGATTLATLDMAEAHLRVANGRGFFRNDDGDWYDSQEWVFTDLRSSVANRHAGRTVVADLLLDWITAQALANQGMVAELQEPTTSAYLGAVPMVGFGAGTYLLALLDREESGTPSPVCGSWETP